MNEYDTKCAARLYFCSVLPVMESLVRQKPEFLPPNRSQQLKMKWHAYPLQSSCTLQLGVGPNQSTNADKKPPQINFHFFSNQQIVRFFEKKWTLPPLPTAGCFLLNAMVYLKKLGDHLDHYLQPNSSMLEDDDFLRVHVLLTLEVAARAACELVKIDSQAAELLAGTSEGLVVFSSERKSSGVWLKRTEYGLCWGHLPCREPIHARVHFSEPKLARHALKDEIDVNAEIGKGNIELRGVAPLADTCGALFQKLSKYIHV